MKINAENHLGEGLCIGTSAMLVQQMSIGSSLIISAGAVVIEYVPEKVIYAGVPAKIISEMIAKE